MLSNNKNYYYYYHSQWRTENFGQGGAEIFELLFA
jgi:hypothetical protein